MPSAETMTPRQRVHDAIRHRETDRIPICLGMEASTGINAFTYWHLREYLGLPIEYLDIWQVVQLMPRVHEDVLDRFHVDVDLVWPAYPETYTWNPRGNYTLRMPVTAQPVLKDGAWRMERQGLELTMPADGDFFEGGYPLFLDGDDAAIQRMLAAEAERKFKETDRALFMDIGPFGAASIFYGSDVNCMCDFAMNPEGFLERGHEQMDRAITALGPALDKAAPFLEGVIINGDLGMQTGPMLAPRQYADFLAPPMKKVCDFIHQNYDLKVFYHCCGSCYDLIPAFIHIGYDILNPVQISAARMDPAALKQEFGNDIVFWGGGCDTQSVLPTGTPDQVKEHVRGLVDIFKPGGGFVFNTVHNIVGNVTPENIVAVFDTAYECGFYSSRK